jgi:putative ABC transport system ATP-binding protein
MTENKTLISVKNLTKKYKHSSGDVLALDTISFELSDGESLAVLGPSGSGKTTLLELMAGLTTPTSGTVEVSGQNVFEGNDNQISNFRNATIGFVFQNIHLQDYFTALENVCLPMIAAGVPKSEQIKRAQKLLKLVGLEERANQYPSQLSGGEMQRVAIARALANNPKIIFADEPTAKLDKANADKVLEALNQIQKDGVSVIMITHDSAIAKTFSNKIELSHGQATSIKTK